MCDIAFNALFAIRQTVQTDQMIDSRVVIDSDRVQIILRVENYPSECTNVM